MWTSLLEKSVSQHYLLDFFSLWFCPHWKLLEFFKTAELAAPTFVALPLRVCRSITYNWSYGTFRYYKEKTSLFSFGLEPPMHQSGSNWTDKYTPCNIRSLLDFIQFYLLEWWPTKHLFSPHNSGWPCKTTSTVYCK